MSAITTFLQSEQALKILGLPGLALLLAFVFYRTMVANRLVTPIGRNQSFIILILIIAYFLVVSVLLIWVYRPERSQPQPMPGASRIAASEVKPSEWDRLDKVMRQASLSTPLTSFDALVGPAASTRFRWPIDVSVAGSQVPSRPGYYPIVIEHGKVAFSLRD